MLAAIYLNLFVYDILEEQKPKNQGGILRRVFRPLPREHDITLSDDDDDMLTVVQAFTIYS